MRRLPEHLMELAAEVCLRQTRAPRHIGHCHRFCVAAVGEVPGFQQVPGPRRVWHTPRLRETRSPHRRRKRLVRTFPSRSSGPHGLLQLTERTYRWPYVPSPLSRDGPGLLPGLMASHDGLFVSSGEARGRSQVSIDVRSRFSAEVRSMSCDEMLDGVLPGAVAVYGDLAARGLRYLGLPPLGLSVEGRDVTLGSVSGDLRISEGIDAAGVVAHLRAAALSELLQDTQSTMGLAMTSQVKISVGNITDWISWEPVLRALLDGRKVHEAGDVELLDLDGEELEINKTFTFEDDREEMANFLEQAGFLHLRGVFDEQEMKALGADVDEGISRARPDDGESWWATDDQGENHAVRVLFFYDKSQTLRSLVEDPRYQVIGGLTGDGHVHSKSGEGLVKPLNIVRGLSDLPWHKDCGQGRHSYVCNGLTTGISVTGADRTSGALGVVPGSHRANTMATGKDRRLDLRPIMLETKTGDVTVHCSDTLHRAHPPVDKERKVVYSSFSLPPRQGETPQTGLDRRRARAQLSDVQTRIEAADNDANPRRYRAGHGR
jgi:Phytanoyl-CoA dioxygenase (PhyH)